MSEWDRPPAGAKSNAIKPWRRVGCVIPPRRNADFHLAGAWQFTRDDARVKLKRLYPTRDV